MSQILQSTLLTVSALFLTSDWCDCSPLIIYNFGEVVKGMILTNGINNYGTEPGYARLSQYQALCACMRELTTVEPLYNDTPEIKSPL